MVGKLRGRGQAELHPDTLIHKTQKSLNRACLSCQANIPGAQCSAHCPASDLGQDTVVGKLLRMLQAVFRGMKSFVSGQESHVFCECPGSKNRLVYYFTQEVKTG